MKNKISIKIKNMKIVVTVMKIAVPIGVLAGILYFLGGYLNTANETLAIGDEVIVQNAVAADGREGINIRVNPGTGSDRKGWVFNGATGTVMKGPKNEDDYRWWEIQWDAGQGEDKVKWRSEYPCDKPPCKAWVAEMIDGSVVLAKKN